MPKALSLKGGQHQLPLRSMSDTYVFIPPVPDIHTFRQDETIEDAEKEPEHQMKALPKEAQRSGHIK